MNNNDPVNWIMEIPVISRTFFLGALVTSIGCSLNMMDPLNLYYNAVLVFGRGQYWRLLTTFLFFGEIGLDFAFHMYFLGERMKEWRNRWKYDERWDDLMVTYEILYVCYLVRYCSLLEGSEFRSKQVKRWLIRW